MSRAVVLGILAPCALSCPLMIQLTCTKCQTLMSLDDAFAGGVCRCQKCGAIQTVPSHLKPVADRVSEESKRHANRALWHIALALLATLGLGIAAILLRRAGYLP